MQSPRTVIPALLLAGAALCALGLTAGLLWHPAVWVVNLLAGAGTLVLGAGLSAVWWQRRLQLLERDGQSLRLQVAEQQQELTFTRARAKTLQSEALSALKDSEALYHSLVEHLPLAVLRKDRTGRYTFVNRNFLEFSGKTESEMLRTTDFDLFPAELAARYRQGDEQVMESGTNFEAVESFVRSDGATLYIQVIKTPVRDAVGNIIGTQVLFWDVTDKHHTEESLTRSKRELEERNAALVQSEENFRRQSDILRLVLDSINDGVVVADETGRFLIWNPAAEAVIGLGAVEKPTEAWSETYGLFQIDEVTVFPPEELPLARAIRGETVHDIDLFVRNARRPAGVYISINGAPLREPSGTIRGGVVVFRDVTRERAIQVALREGEERARLIVETAYDAFIAIDARGMVVDWNRRACELFGFSREEARGRLLTNLIIPQQYQEAHTEGIRRYFETGIGPVLNTRIEISAMNRDGREFPVELTIWPLRTANGCFFQGFVHDISRRKRIQQEIQSKNQDLETLLYVISHDLREPLRAIQNFSKIVAQRYSDKLDDKGQDFLRRVVNGAERLDRLLEDVLQLSRVERTAQPDEVFDTAEIVTDVVRRLEPRIRETGAAVRICEPLPRIRADRRWATQAVQNLVSNALKYTQEGQTPDVEIGEFRGAEGTGLVVRDRGMGVPPDCTERIFQLFQRAVSRNIEGTGAGLAIVKRVAERHGGRAWVRPRDGGGSEFFITFGTGHI